MGYESKLYVVEKTGSTNENGQNWGRIIATYDMCKFGGFNGIFKTDSNCFVYADDGNTEITEDRYGQSLKEATVIEVIEYLEKYQLKNEYYRRVAPLLGLLKSFNLSEWKNITILHYGH